MGSLNSLLKRFKRNERFFFESVGVPRGGGGGGGGGGYYRCCKFGNAEK